MENTIEQNYFLQSQKDATTQIILTVSKRLQEVVEGSFVNYPLGSCYLVGHCMSELLKKWDYESRVVTGELTLRTRNGKVVRYGHIRKNGEINVGYYHTWCEVNICDESFIVDPSLKYIFSALKTYHSLKIISSVPEILISSAMKTNNYQYSEKDSLAKYSNENLSKLSIETIDNIIDAVRFYSTAEQETH